MVANLASKPGRGFWIIGAVALAWNLVGILTFVMQVTMTPEQIAALPEAERQLYAAFPAWVTGAYAVAVVAGTLGSVALLLRKAWAVPVFALSLAAVVVQMGYLLFLTRALEVRGAASAALPVLVTAIAAFLVWYALTARRRAWLG